MKFEPLSLPGAVLVRMERYSDERGFFARSACTEEFVAQGLSAAFVQSSISWNPRRGTLRGLHFQWPPSGESKLVRCVRGSIHDVLLDLRPGGPTYLSSCALVLDQDCRDAVYIPSGVAHGFQTLTDECEVLYQMTDFHVPSLAAGVRWNDPAFAISWPIKTGLVIAPRDAQYPDFNRVTFERELALRKGGTAGSPP
jgi:dTDP-4-dehydrorhamnose 3,5-epimerase